VRAIAARPRAAELLVYLLAAILRCCAAHQFVPPVSGLPVTPAKRVGVNIDRHTDGALYKRLTYDFLGGLFVSSCQ
jgi:hypothetical protein